MEIVQPIKLPIVESGIYVLKKKKKVVYIGESGNVLLRIGQHLKNDIIDFDSVEAFELDESTRKYVESILINTYLPLYNNYHKNAFKEVFDKSTPHERLLMSMGISEKFYSVDWQKEKVMINHIKTVISFIIKKYLQKGV